ncbi:gamma-glutamylcyclotransferase family protein [Thermocoleostomius sinensis]|jgi:cation transport regulator ChaC|uniref:Gamma-glutamylcyclotransferase n=1 Tax=Thermocoleostomius sinensis A174 TaxID=2016057 RepID=A0A9E9C8A0_9CYAN|nr:gamma-glutamylcyclotransferase family protein [Thermocoleostomius sinensis]WAL58202.1 gamma-glutamylcyclotransferase [Thermocoleostomius sinensis A174]
MSKQPLRQNSQWLQAEVTQSLSTPAEPTFYYFAYGSCMCPVDLKRSLGEHTHSYVIGPATLKHYRLGFFRRSHRRNCGVLDIVPEPGAIVQGVLYQLPLRLSGYLDEREEGYCHEMIEVDCQGQSYTNVRTYTVIEKLTEEHAPNDWYFNVVLRGAITCGLPEQYCWQLFHHMHQLQQAAHHHIRQNQVA